MRTFHIGLIVVLVALTGCATTPSIKAMQADIAGFELPQLPAADKAMVYVVRPSMLGFVIGFEVYVDQKKVEYKVGKTQGGEYIYFEVTPGSHILLSQAENLAEYQFNALATGVYFFEQIPSTGFLIARNDLRVIMDVAGKYWVKKLKVGTLQK